MKKAYLEEVDYGAFKRALGQAQRQGNAVVPADRAAWATTVRTNQYTAEAFALLAGQRYGANDLVIITGPEPWNGLFASDHEAQICVRLRTKEVG